MLNTEGALFIRVWTLPQSTISYTLLYYLHIGSGHEFRLSKFMNNLRVKWTVVNWTH